LCRGSHRRSPPCASLFLMPRPPPRSTPFPYTTLFRSPDLDHKRDKTPRLCVPETSGTDEAHAARQDPCLAKTRRILHLISQFRSRPDRLGCGESNIMKPSPDGCKGYLHLSCLGSEQRRQSPRPAL